MDFEAEARREWEEAIRRKTIQVQRDWVSTYTGNVSLEDALVGVFADCYDRKGIPRVLVRNSEGRTVQSLFLVFNRILTVMKTLTLDTLNYTHPEAVELATDLCLRDSITGGDHADRDAAYVLNRLVGDGYIVYTDMGRDFPAYVKEIKEQLINQFGGNVITEALKGHAEFSRILNNSVVIAEHWIQRNNQNGDAKNQIELGLTQLADFWPKQSSQPQDSVNQFCSAVRGFVVAKDRELVPYRRAQYALRGIPVSRILS